MRDSVCVHVSAGGGGDRGPEVSGPPRAKLQVTEATQRQVLASELWPSAWTVSSLTLSAISQDPPNLISKNKPIGWTWWHTPSMVNTQKAESGGAL